MIISRSATIRIRKNKEKLVKMFGLVVVIFVICWAPYHIYFIYSYHNPSITQVKLIDACINKLNVFNLPYVNLQISYIGHIYLLFYWLAMCQTCVNPIIYYWMNR